MFAMLVIVDCIMAIACVYLCHQCITLVASVNSVNTLAALHTAAQLRLSTLDSPQKRTDT